MALLQEMAGNSEVKKERKCRRAWRQPSGALALFLLLLLWTTHTAQAAAPSAPQLGETDWRTGEIEVKWSGVTPGYTIILFTATHETGDSYRAHDTWTAETSEGSYIVKYLENGQTIWHYIVQVNPATGEMSPPSAVARQTPPATVYVINWPDMFRQLVDMVAAANQSMQDKLDSLFTPSDKAMAELQQAVNDLKQASGFGAAETAGSGIRDGLTGSQAGMKPPVVQDDGVHTWTGGPTGGSLPNVKGGTETELTMKIPLFANPDGSLHYFTFFTKEQLDKFMWLALLRKVVVSMMWISFAIWMVVRFTPALKA